MSRGDQTSWWSIKEKDTMAVILPVPAQDLELQ